MLTFRHLQKRVTSKFQLQSSVADLLIPLKIWFYYSASPPVILDNCFQYVGEIKLNY